MERKRKKRMRPSKRAEGEGREKRNFEGKTADGAAGRVEGKSP